MSLANPTHTNRPLAKLASVIAFVVLGALACGVVVAQPTTPPAPMPGVKDTKDAKDAKEEPRSPTQPQDPNANKADPNSPLDADAPGRQPHAKYVLKTTDEQGRPILYFYQVVDGPAVASEKENRSEYDAWVSTVLHARKFTTTELEEHGARDLIPLDLHMVRSFRTRIRYELLRFDGKLVSMRRLDAPQYFKDNPELKITELYEARFVPLNESPLTPMSIVFLDLPDAFADVAKKPFKEWVDREVWVAAAGFYFKTMSVPGPNGTTVSVPVVVGKSITPLSGPPAVEYNDPTALDRNVRVFKFIRDEAPMIRTDSEGWAEAASANRVLIHSARFTPEQLEEHALSDVKFADLFEDSRHAYKLKNVKFEGRLIRVRTAQVNNELKAAGVEQVFEGWLIPANEPRGNPICIMFTKLPDGVEPGDRVNKWVTFAGFYFKKMKYKSGEADPKRPGEFIYKYAPLVLGRGPIARDERDPDRPTSVTWGAFVLGAIACGVLLIGSAGVLTWYYRKGDRRAKQAMDAVRNRNPFDPNAEPNQPAM